MRAITSMRASVQEPAIPLREYFLAVGGALLALLIATDWLLPRPALRPDHRYDRPVVRIHSDVKGPEAVVIDGKAAQLAAPAATHSPAVQRTPVLPIIGADNAPVESPTVSESVENDGFPHSAPAPTIGNSYAQLGPEPRARNAGSRSHRAAAGVRKRSRAKSQPTMSFAQEQRRIP